MRSSSGRLFTVPRRPTIRDGQDFFGSADHEKLLTLVAQRISDGRVLRRALGCDRREVLRRTMTRRLRRNEEARFYHYRARKRLAPQRLNLRC